MGRFSPGMSCQHRVQRLSNDIYEISWVVDYYYKGCRQRFPRHFRRLTDEAGARRFAMKWDVKIRDDGS
jgi:hypothetical protein